VLLIRLMPSYIRREAALYLHYEVKRPTSNYNAHPNVFVIPFSCIGNVHTQLAVELGSVDRGRRNFLDLNRLMFNKY
jgi:hypothetical protein